MAPSLLPLNRTKIITESAVKNDEQEKQSFLAHSLFFSLFSNHDIWTFSFFFFFFLTRRTNTRNSTNYQLSKRREEAATHEKRIYLTLVRRDLRWKYTRFSESPAEIKEKMRKHRNHVHSYGKEWPLCNEMYRYLGNDNVSRVPEIGWSVVQGAAAWSRRNTAPFDEHWAAILRQRGCVDVEKTWTVASCPSRFPSSHHRTTDATLQGTLTRITPLLAHTPPRPYSSHRPASTASTLSHFLSLSPTRCYAPRGSHPRGTCARILPPVRRNSSRRAVGIGKKTERGKRKKDTERGWLERVKIWGAAFSEKKKKKR